MIDFTDAELPSNPAPNTSCCEACKGSTNSKFGNVIISVCILPSCPCHQSSHSKGESWEAEWAEKSARWDIAASIRPLIVEHISKLLSERDKQAVTRQRKYDEIQIGKAFIAGAEAERARILAALDKLGNEVGLKPHFPGGALEKKKEQQLEIIRKMMALLSPNQTQ